MFVQKYIVFPTRQWISMYNKVAYKLGPKV